MAGRIKAAVWPDQNMAAKRHLCTVQNDRVVIGVKMLANGNVIAIIAPEVGFYMNEVTPKS